MVRKDINEFKQSGKVTTLAGGGSGHEPAFMGKFLPHSPEGLSGYCFHPWCPDGRVGGRREIVCPGCISETVRCRKFILGRDIGWGV